MCDDGRGNDYYSWPLCLKIEVIRTICLIQSIQSKLVNFCPADCWACMLQLRPQRTFSKIPTYYFSSELGLGDNSGKCTLFLIPAVPQQFFWNTSQVGHKMDNFAVTQVGHHGYQEESVFLGIIPQPKHRTKLIRENFGKISKLGVLLAWPPKIIYFLKNGHLFLKQNSMQIVILLSTTAQFNDLTK